jgi:hypothetical protein
MHKPLYILIGSCLAPAAGAQPTLNAGAMSHLPGEIVLMRQCDHMSPGDPGAGQVWNFAALTCQPANSTTYVTPTTTDFASSFPTATVAIEGYPTQYFEGNTLGYSWLGHAWGGTGDLNVVSCDGGKQIITYPFTMGSTLYDYSACPYDYNNGQWGTTLTKIVDVEADGYGNLITPYGTIANVLRIHWTEHGGDNDGSYEYDSYWFVKPGIKEPIVAVWSKIDDYSGPPVTTEFTTLLDQSMVGVQELISSAIGLDVSPNPAQDRINVTCSVPGGQVMVLEILDTEGRTQYQEVRSVKVPGIHVREVGLHDLAPGMYLLRVTSGDGALGTKRFLKM